VALKTEKFQSQERWVVSSEGGRRKTEIRLSNTQWRGKPRSFSHRKDGLFPLKAEEGKQYSV
jgi:hypothetical protein